MLSVFFFSCIRRHTRCALVTGVQTCALPILSGGQSLARRPVEVTDRRASWPITRGKVWGSARPRTVKLCVTDLGSRRSAQRVAAHRSTPDRAFESRGRAPRTGLTIAQQPEEHRRPSCREGGGKTSWKP